jgi:hypothetical protein
MATTTTLQSVDIPTLRSFRDLDLNFTNHPIRKDVNSFSNEYAIINSVKNLIFTQHYERPFQPSLGSNLRRMLFEPIDAITAAQIEREITEVVRNFEPRADISKVIARPSPDQNRYDVQVEFFLINNPNPVTINFFLERIR